MVRTFPDDVDLSSLMTGREISLAIVDRNAELGVTWVHSYLSLETNTSYCIYDSPDEEALRRAAERNRLPLDTATRVSVLSPYQFQ